MRVMVWALTLGLLAGVACGDGGAVSSACKSDESCLSGDAVRCVAGSCVVPRCPMGSRYVAGGRFRQGCNAMEADCESSAQPAHSVTLSSGFCLAEHEISVAEYRRCLGQGTCTAPVAPESLASLRCSSDRATWTEGATGDETLAMSCLLWSEAVAYCTSVGGRLPTEAEWEHAARGRDDRSFPWGTSDPVSCDQGANFLGLGCSGLPWSTVASERSGSMLRGAFGQVDLAGNLSEWVADYFDAKAYGSCSAGCEDPAGPGAGEVRVRRGGTFLSPASELRSYAREFHRPSGPRSDLIGARCAFDLAR